MIPKHIINPNPEIYLSNNFLVIDVETTNLEKGSAINKDNRLLYTSIWHSKKGWIKIKGNEHELSNYLELIYEVDFIVAHNAKFELQWLVRAGLDLTRVLVYDTMLGEYVISGNRRFRLDLNSVAARCKVGAKENFISFCIKKGVCPSLLPFHLLAEYCDQDVNITHKVFKIQREWLSNAGLLPVFFTRCIFTPVIAEMEAYGLQLDRELVAEIHTESQAEHHELIEELNAMTGGINMASPLQVADYLYNQLKFKEVQNRYGKPIRGKPCKAFPDGLPKTDIKTISVLNAKNKKQKRFLELKGRESKLRKKISAYTTTFMEACDNHGGLIHGKINQANTKTHRLSSCLTDRMWITTKKGLHRLADVKDGMEVLTHRGRYKPVLNKWCNGVKEVYKITLDNGMFVECTSNHRLLTNKGWLSLEDIYGGENEQEFNNRFSNNTEGTRHISWRKETYPRTSNEKVRSELSCSEQNIKQRTNPRNTRSRETIKVFAEQAGQQESYEGVIWETSSQLQRSYLRWKGLFNSIKTFLVYGKINQAYISPSYSNVRGTRDNKNTGRICSSSYKRSENGQSNRELSISIRTCSCPAAPIFSNIREVEYVGTLPVYDLEIEADSCFLANGIFVHNSKPNLQNIERGLKKVVTARHEGWVVRQNDYDQLEYRVAGFLAQCPVALECINRGEDPHVLSASMLFGEEFTKLDTSDPIYKELRNQAKADTFKPLYGGMTGSKKQVAYYKEFLKKHTGIAQWHYNLLNEAMETDKIKTITGLTFYFPNTEYTHSGYILNSTNIKNYPVQMFATADIATIGTTLLWYMMKNAGVQSFIVNEVHDSVVIEQHPDENDIISDLSEVAMCGAVVDYLHQVFDIDYNFPLTIDQEINDNWGFDK